jgi:hypothetical protein
MKLASLQEMLERHLVRARELNTQLRTQTAAARPATSDVK